MNEQNELNRIIERDFTIKYDAIDFLSRYCEANDLDMLDLTLAQEKEIYRKIIEIADMGLSTLKDQVVSDINERLLYLF